MHGIIKLSESVEQIRARSCVQCLCVVKQCDRKQAVSPVLAGTKQMKEDGAVVSNEIAVS